MRMNPKIESYRVTKGVLSSPTASPCGMFLIPYRSNTLTVMVSDGLEIVDGWEHVSISLKNRCPNWEEMCFVKDLFWDEEETVQQLHVPKSLHINIHPHCLHLWRKINGNIELPPSYMV